MTLDLCRKYNWLLSAVLSFCSLLGLLYYGLRLRGSILSATNSVVSVLLFVLFLIIYHKAFLILNRRNLTFSLLGGLLLSGMLVLGSEIYTSDKVNLLAWKKWVGILFVGLLFAAILVCLLNALPDIRNKCSFNRLSRTQERYFNGNWPYYFIIWGIIFLCWVPALLGGYPGIYSYDSDVQMQYLEPGNHISAMHPVLHSLFLNGTLRLGNLVFGSMQIGMLIHSITQMLILSAIYAYACRFVAKRKVPVIFQILLIGLFALWPVNAILSISTTKDVLFAGIMLLTVLFTFDMVQNRETFFRSWKKMGRYLLVIFLMLAMRNNGIYVFIVILPFMIIILRKQWKRLIGMCAACLLLFFVYTGPVYSAFGIAQGSIGEALSVPLQQMVRAAQDNRGELTDEEKAQLTEIIPEKYIKAYNSRISDPIKRQLNVKAFSANPSRYLKLWVKIGLKCPGTYINAFFSNNFGFWYPDMVYPDPPAWHQYVEFKTTGSGYIDTDMHTKSPRLLTFYRNIAYNTVHQKIPVLSMIFSPGFSFWLLFIYLLAVIYYKKYKLLLPGLFLFLLWGTLLLGPVVLIRYAYPIMVGIPCLFVLLLNESSWEIKTARRKRI